MRTSTQVKTLSYPVQFENWILLISVIVIVMLLPMLSHGQEGYPKQVNPHAEMEEPMLPPPGIVGVALHLTAERIGDPAGLYIRATHPAGPGARAGLAHGQEILAVDGQSVRGKTYREVVAIIRGEIGKSVTLSVRTFTDVRDVKIIRVSEDMLSEEKHT